MPIIFEVFMMKYFVKCFCIFIFSALIVNLYSCNDIDHPDGIILQNFTNLSQDPASVSSFEYRSSLQAKEVDSHSLSSLSKVEYDANTYQNPSAAKVLFNNNAYLIDWLGDGFAIKNFAGAVIRNSSYYFRQAGTWSTIASANFSMRYSPKGFLFESKGSGCFANDDRNLFYIIGFLNSKPVKSILLVLSPTLDYHEGPLGRVPIIFDHKVQCQVDELASNNIAASKVDWDSFETSWDFKKHPLI